MCKIDKKNGNSVLYFKMMMNGEYGEKTISNVTRDKLIF